MPRQRFRALQDATGSAHPVERVLAPDPLDHARWYGSEATLERVIELSRHEETRRIVAKAENARKDAKHKRAASSHTPTSTPEQSSDDNDSLYMHTSDVLLSSGDRAISPELGLATDDVEMFEQDRVCPRTPSPELVDPTFIPRRHSQPPTPHRAHHEQEYEQHPVIDPASLIFKRHLLNPMKTSELSSLPTPPASEQEDPTTAIARPVKRVKPAATTTEPRAATKQPRQRRFTRAELTEIMFDRTNWVEPDKDLQLVNGKPPIWCAGRQELCESVSYMKSYQGGHYDLNERCFGYLLDGFGSVNDCCLDGGRTIISHGGGCSEGSGDTYKLRKDQTRDNIRMRALYNCMKRNTPVALIAGHNWSFFPKLKDMNSRYAVLGYYFVRDIWVEAEASPTDENPAAYFTRFKILFEWQPSQGRPWFHELVSVSDRQVSSAEPLPTKFRCTVCSTTSSRPFAIELCLNENCVAFFKQKPDSPLVFDQHSLTYNSAFLRPHTKPDWPTRVPCSLFPTSLQSMVGTSTDFSRLSWRGYFCSRCGRLSSRVEWRVLRCSHCNDFIDIQAELYRAKDLIKTTKRKEPIVKQGFKVTEARFEGSLQGWTIELAPDARVHHVWSTSSADKAKADDLFEKFQGSEASSAFKRSRMPNSIIAGGGLCSQFSFNTGEKYHYGVTTETLTFDRASSSLNADAEIDKTDANVERQRTAPSCVHESCTRIDKVVQNVCGDIHEVRFNEILSVAYMQGGKMSFHDDGEVGLGPIVASMSLGSDADMTFRRKLEKKSPQKKHGDRAGAEFDGETPAVVIQGKKKKKQRTWCLRTTLRHGDFLIMEGRGVQQYFDHMVQPVNLRYAATARFISADHARLSNRKAKVSEPQAGPSTAVEVKSKPAQVKRKRTLPLPPLVVATPVGQSATDVAHLRLPRFKKARKSDIHAATASRSSIVAQNPAITSTQTLSRIRAVEPTPSLRLPTFGTQFSSSLPRLAPARAMPRSRTPSQPSGLTKLSFCSLLPNLPTSSRTVQRQGSHTASSSRSAPFSFTPSSLNDLAPRQPLPNPPSGFAPSPWAAYQHGPNVTVGPSSSKYPAFPSPKRGIPFGPSPVPPDMKK
ncbi:hypothetical protein ACM66B_003390 [Microbotryomycetes sp. NB124-2]